MAPSSYRDDRLIVIQIGSQTTKVTNGLGESLAPPQFHIATVVGQVSGSSSFFIPSELTEAKSYALIRPIRRGFVENWDALIFLWSHILYEKAGLPNPLTPDNSDHPVMLLVPSVWSPEDRERATKIFMEAFALPAFMIHEESLAGLYACGSLHGLVVDIGCEKTDITPIVDSLIVPYAKISIPLGGFHQTQYLQKLLRDNPPKLNGEIISDVSFDLAEQIKTSGITELRLQNIAEITDEDPVEDIAEVVASGKTKEYIAKKEAEKQRQVNETLKLNIELEYNSFTAPKGTILVGPERFLTHEILEKGYEGCPSLPEAVHLAVSLVEPTRRGDMWENLLICGGGARVKGLRPHLLSLMSKQYTAASTAHQPQPFSIISTPSGSNGTNTPVNPGSGNQAGQASNVRLLKIPEYFIEWKEGKEKAVFEEVCFLGGQILGKVTFNDAASSIGAYLTREEYFLRGPSEIHRV
ncbi:SWI/SNF and RSC complexes subunit arp9 [Neolecta irregularis DAH-3]|uniref:SWI/SNF and RSC complexes subunit arp9 n=1 Tax=Neolecta irregularis (strain DAH-3) TaxID=1198029 RepID=A0A1U7LIZ5_NEOID|nr:SWI/SNF and RSC complexes subunit arp9 [Neolecta irregularis DAH-3]|eukprot:OLL22598.1 SWI/SNF and RSC complexes subunit arp9 [Neolecta irregularis DAH-3]